MSFKKTACLASLLLACPLVAPAVSVADDWTGKYAEGTEGNVEVALKTSDFEISEGSYDNIYFGHAVHNGTTGSAVVSTDSYSVSKDLTALKAKNLYIGYAEGKEVSAEAKVLRGSTTFSGIDIQEHMYVNYAYGNTAYATSYSANPTYSFKVTVQKANFAENGELYGARAEAVGEEGAATAEFGNLTLGSGIYSTVYGVWASSQSGKARASHGNVFIREGLDEDLENVEVRKDIYGAYAESLKTGTAHAQASVLLCGGTYSGDIYGAYAKANSGKATVGGGYIDITQSYKGKLPTLDKTVALYAGKAVASGEGGEASVLDSYLTLHDIEVGNDLYAGYAEGNASASACRNHVELRGGTYSGDIYGGYAKTSSGAKSEAYNNTIMLWPGLRNGDMPVFADTTVLWGGCADIVKDVNGNCLHFAGVKGITAGNIKNFHRLEYALSEVYAGDIILTLKDKATTDISNAYVEVGVYSLHGKDDGEFLPGDKVVLLQNDAGINAEGFTQKVSISATTGVSLAYDDVVVQANETELILTRPKADDDSGKDDDSGNTDGDSGKDDDSGKSDSKPVRVQSGTKAIAEAAASGLALVNESSNAAIEFLRDFSLTSGAITPFVHVQASSMRHETGSSINVSAVSLMAGLGTGIETGAGNLSLGAFFEYGKGSYTTNNSFDDRSDIDGDGNSWYMGGGILAKMEFLQTGPGHFYLEGSAHMGTLHNEYDSNDLYDASGNVAKFDMDSPYYSLHGGLGYVWNMAEGHDLDIYGKYIWTRVQGTDDTLTTKDKFEYDDMDSNRIRFGVRYSYNGSERFKPYVGAAFEHEFSGSCSSTAYGHPVAAPSFEGSSGMGELGLMMKPTEDLPLSINLGVQGYVGQKQGVSGSCNVMYEF